MKTLRFTVSVNCFLSNGVDYLEEKQEKEEFYEDDGFIILPDSYSETGEPTRLVINCHGAGGTVTTDDSQAEHQVITQYLLANGYAVMDVNGLPKLFAEKKGIDIRNNIGSPIAIRSYINAYNYCMEHFNLKRQVFVHGASMGGISSTNLVLSGKIPVIAHSAYCPVLDTYNEIFLHPWCDGLPKFALGIIYGLSVNENGEYIYDENKVKGFNPVKNEKIKNYPVPAKFWHCLDDGVVSFDVTKAFVDKINSNGGTAYIRSFTTGGHEPQLVGEPVENCQGVNYFNGTKLEITPAVEETFAWIKSFDK